MPIEKGVGLLRCIRAILDKAPPEQDPRDVVIEQQDRELGRLRDDLARHKGVHRENGRLHRQNGGLQRQIERLERENEHLKQQLGAERRAGTPASRAFRQETATGSRRPSRPAARCALWPAGAPPVSGAGRRDHCGAGADELSGLRRRGRSDRRGVAVSGRPPPGAPAGAPLRHRGRPLLAVSAAYPGPPRPADLRRVGGGPRTARSRRGRAGRRVAHPRRPAAGQGRRPAADPLRPAGDAGGPRESAASCGSRRDAGLRGVARAGSQRSGGHGR